MSVLEYKESKREQQDASLDKFFIKYRLCQIREQESLIYCLLHLFIFKIQFRKTLYEYCSVARRSRYEISFCVTIKYLHTKELVPPNDKRIL